MREVAAKMARGPPFAIRFIERAVYHGTRIDLRPSLNLNRAHSRFLE